MLSHCTQRMVVTSILCFSAFILWELHSCPLRKEVGKDGLSFQADLCLPILLPQPPSAGNIGVCYHTQLAV